MTFNTLKLTFLLGLCLSSLAYGEFLSAEFPRLGDILLDGYD